MKTPFTGGCSCGAIRYEITAEPSTMLKCHCRDCQRVTGGGFAAAVLVPVESFRLTRGQLRYHFTSSIARGKHNALFVPTADREIPAANLRSNRSSSEFWPAPWMIRVGFGRRWIFSFRTLNLGIKWTRRFRNSSSIRHQQRNK